MDDKPFLIVTIMLSLFMASATILFGAMTYMLLTGGIQ